MANYPGRTVNDEIWTCSGCSMKVMSRGADVTEWKGVQLTDGPELSWFCGNAACKALRDQQIRERTRELRVAAGLPPNPKMKQKESRPIPNRQSGGSFVFAPPPGGFAVLEKIHEEEEDGSEDPRREPPHDRVRAQGR
jgi:hypothetical protein